jgi:formate dehydrogenase major subunit
MTKLNRRDFLKSIGMTTVGFKVFGGAALPEKSLPSWPIKLGPTKIKQAHETTTICPYCGVGCGIIVYTENGKVVHTEGDPDHPINEGSLCPKGMSISDLSFVVNQKNMREPNKQRVMKVLYRAPYSEKWEEKSWDWTLREITDRVKKTRDASFERKDNNGVTVNRTQAIAHLGSASLDNEENYLLHKLMRALGVVNLDHHARL